MSPASLSTENSFLMMKERRFVMSTTNWEITTGNVILFVRVLMSHTFLKGEKSVRVCQPFFVATLAVGKNVVNNALKQRVDVGTFVGQDGRGKHPSKNKTSERDLEGVCRHIEAFPALESHYTRKDTKRKYLQCGLNIRKMATVLYPEWCAENSCKPVKENVYRKILTTEYNLGFHVPKKDQCLTCAKYDNLQGDAKKQFNVEYEAHNQRKRESNEQKEADKKHSKENANFQAVTFDLQAVLYTP